jgi:hypothetical protein
MTTFDIWTAGKRIGEDCAQGASSAALRVYFVKQTANGHCGEERSYSVSGAHFPTPDRISFEMRHRRPSQEDDQVIWPVLIGVEGCAETPFVIPGVWQNISQISNKFLTHCRDYFKFDHRGYAHDCLLSEVMQVLARSSDRTVLSDMKSQMMLARQPTQLAINRFL